MKALLGLAKERRKQQDREFKPMANLNLQQRQQKLQQYQQYGEEFQEEYEPDDEQIIAYAQYLGIRLPEEEDLLYIAKEGLMANLPPDWDEHEEEDGNIIYVNRRTGQALAEHPCDEYYRQLVVKQRKKRGGNQPIGNKFTGIQPVGGGLSQQSKVFGSQAQPKKDMDPLVKMQMEKKKKKLYEQKKKQYEDKKKQIKEKYDKKKQQLQAQFKTKQRKAKQKFEGELESERSKMKKKMSQQQKIQQQKTRKQMERFERQTRAKLQKKYSDRRVIERQKIEKNMKAKREQIRMTLQNMAKTKRKQLQQQYKQKLRILGQKQKQAVNQTKSQADLLNQEIKQLKDEIIRKRIKDYSQKINQEKEIQQAQFRAKLNQIEKAHEDIIRNIETSGPKNQIKFDSLTQEVEQIEKQQLEALQYELSMMKQVKKAQKQETLQRFKKNFEEEKKDDLQRLERQNENLLLKYRKLKEEEYLSKLAQAQKKIKQSYLNSLKEMKQKFDQQQQIIQLQGQATRKDETVEKQSLEMMNQMAQKLGWKEEALRGEINAIREEIAKLSKNLKPVKHKLNDDQLRMYELIKERLEQNNFPAAY